MVMLTELSLSLGNSDSVATANNNIHNNYNDKKLSYRKQTVQLLHNIEIRVLHTEAL